MGMKLSWLACLLVIPGCLDDGTATVSDDLLLPPLCLISPGPTVHSTDVTSAETWAGNTVHVVSSSIALRAPVQIGACAIVQLDPGVSITIPAGGSLTTLTNSSGLGVTFARHGATAWAQIAVTGGALSLAGAKLNGGGIVKGGEILVKSGSLLVQNTTITDATEFGIDLQDGAAIDPTSYALSIHGTAAPVRAFPDLVGDLPSGDYTGNTNNAIIVSVPGRVRRSQTWRLLGVPYQIGDGYTTGSVDVFGDVINPRVFYPTLLTLVPGAKLLFKMSTQLRIEPDLAHTEKIGLFSVVMARGGLIANGTTDKPIVFDTAEKYDPQRMWQGIRFGTTTNSSSLNWVAVAHAGQDITEELGCPSLATSYMNAGAILLFTKDPAASFMQNIVIYASHANGIVRGWSGYPGTDFTDPLLNIQFAGYTPCKQTAPMPTGAQNQMGIYCPPIPGC